ncbi:MAG: sigma factor-like helix-turn-helix DNA-binding protein [Actinomycetota bacterium]
MERVVVQDEAIKAGGDPGAEFARFYAGHHDRLYRALALTIRDTDLAHEAIDEAMARAAERWDKVSDYAAPEGWVYRVALNWSRSVFRTRGRRWLRAPSIVECDRLPDPDVNNAIARLPHEQRVVVVARYYLDWPLADIATSLDVPVGTVKSRLSRAQKRLADILEASHDNS